MASVEKQRERLITLLGDLFQLNQPDLDFGFYRIMHAKADRVSSFLQNDLLKIIREAFGEADGKRVEEIRLAYEDAIKKAKEFGAPNPEETEPVKKAKAAYDALKDAGNGEGEIYDHLFRFFERYYDNGDFMSRRYYARETDGKAAPYSVPYDGREVYLHWANRDQYYIKTSEYLTNFTFNLANAPELKGLFEQETRKVHCRIIEAAEGEHGNVKTTDKTERYFLINKDEPIKIENGDLVIQFEYRPDPEKSGQGGKWQEKRVEEAEKVILEALKSLGEAKVFVAPLSTLIGQDKDRTLLRRYLNQYTSRNTMDYFIHKDLGGFMRRELDFYIKNEIMRLDDIESADVPRVDFYLSKIKVLRKIAHHLIDFLAQLEDFQKKLWLKKKFVVETNYCLTLDRIPEGFYTEIAVNEAQRGEWAKLFAIEDLKGYKAPLSTAFLKDNPFLVLDTVFFDEAFKARLLAEIQDLDERANGLLVHSENSSALSFMEEKHEGSVRSIYIDPPYNTDASAILYKNDYKDSSWLSLIESRIQQSAKLLNNEGIFCFAIDDEEVAVARKVLERIFPKEIGIAVVRANPQSRKTKGRFSPVHEYALFYGRSESASPSSLEITGKRMARYPNTDEKGRYSWMNFIRTGNNDKRADRPKLYYPIYVSSEDKIRVPELSWNAAKEEYDILEKPSADEIVVYPISDTNGKIIEKNWHRGNKRVTDEPAEYRIRRDSNGKKISIDFKTRMDEESTPTTWWDKNEYASANYGAAEIKDLFGEKNFDFPKARKLVEDCLRASGLSDDGDIVIDYFGGSATTAHATIELNRADNSNRKYILVEMGNHFDDVVLPRVKKVTYSRDWKEGKPVSRDGISQCFKYMRLETYEDALNNLAFREDATRERALAKNDDFRREYMLNYWLEFETKGSPSLLSVGQFSDPTAYKLKIKKPGSDEYVEKAVDLIETFSWLIGLHVDHIDAPRTFGGNFKRETDPELPNDQTTRLILDGKLTEDANGKWWFRKVEGRVCRTPGDKKNMDKVLIIWRKLTGNLEEDNLMLDEWFKKYRLSTQDTEFDVIYVNGSNNLPNLKRDDENWKVRLIEESFHQKMWDVEG